MKEAAYTHITPIPNIPVPLQDTSNDCTQSRIQTDTEFNVCGVTLRKQTA